MGRRPSTVLALLLLTGLALGVPGCVAAPAQPAPGAKTAKAAKPATREEPAEEEAGIPSSGLDRLAQGEGLPQPGADGKYSKAEVDRFVAEQIRIHDEIKKQQAMKTSDRPPRPAQAAPAPATPIQANPPHAAPAPQTPAAAPIPPANAGLSALTNTPPEAPKTEPAAPDDSPKLAPPTAPADERLNLAADELARALRDRAAASRTPAAEYAALAWLDTIRPSVLGSLENGPAARALDPRQRQSLTVARDIVGRLMQDPAVMNDPERMWRSVTDAGTAITQSKDVRITGAELCTRVNGFGQYEPVKDRALLAGSPHALVVYAEVDSYGVRKTAESDGDRFTVDLGHAVEIWQDADRPTLQRRWSETSIKDVSRRMRRDFYITSVIELPPNLSVGAYNLKIIVKDHLRGAQSEKTIPFTIIADGAIVSAG